VRAFLIYKSVRNMLLIQMTFQPIFVVLGEITGGTYWPGITTLAVCLGYFGGWLAWRARAFAKSLQLATSSGVPRRDLLRLFCHRRVWILGQFRADLSVVGNLRIWDIQEDRWHWMHPLVCHPFRMPWPDILVLYAAAPESFRRWCGNVYL